MSKVYRKLIVAFIVVFVFSCLAPTFTIAAEKPTSKKYLGTYTISGSTKQVKVYRYTYSKRWTPTKVLKGQPSGGYYLSKGDALFYVDSNSGISASVSYGGVSISVPLGKVNKKSIGIAKTASKKGYYVLQCQKQVTPYVDYALETRTRTYSFYPWSSWKKTKTVYRKGYTVNKVKPTLKKK